MLLNFGKTNIMTPKEKAIELVHKFKCYTGKYYNSKRNIITSKQCALIAVDEIIKANPYEVSKTDMDSTIEYWQQVKQEINNL